MDLYELNEQMAGIQERILEAAWTGEYEHDEAIPEEMAKLLDEVKLEIEDKVADCGRMVKNLMATQGMLKEEISKLQSKVAKAKLAETRLREYLVENMAMSGVDKVKDGAISVRRAKRPTRVEVDEFDPRRQAVKVLFPGGLAIEATAIVRVPESVGIDLWRQSLEFNVSKAKVKEEWEKTGKVPEGLHVIDNEEMVVVS